jgi:hypothetical protein
MIKRSFIIGGLIVLGLGLILFISARMQDKPDELLPGGGGGGI